MRVHGVLHGVPGARRWHSTAVGQSVQRPNQPGAQEEQKAKGQAQDGDRHGRRGHCSVNTPSKPIAVRHPRPPYPPLTRHPRGRRIAALSPVINASVNTINTTRGSVYDAW